MKRTSSQRTTLPLSQGQDVVVRNRQKRYKSKVPYKVFSGRQPFAKQSVKTLVYAEQVALTLTSGAYTEYKIKCNGMYDPNTTGIGHQPLYFDQLMEIYDHYCVTSSKIVVTPVPSTSTQALIIVLFKDDDTTTNTTSAQAAIERPGASYATAQCASSALYPRSLTSKWSAKETFAGDPLSREELSGSSTADPTEITTYVICGQDSAVVTSIIVLTIRVEYTVTFYELKSVNAS